MEHPMKTLFSETAATRRYIGIALMLGLATLSGPALAQEVPIDGVREVGEGIWNFMIENVVLIALVLGALGALIGGMFGNPAQAVGRAIVCAFLGVVAASIPAFAEWAMSQGGGGISL
jgi:hypothetical protein